MLLVITARFGRLFWKYRSVAYAVVLKHIGVLYQNLYLVATNMGLAPCALGGGDSDVFAKATGLNYVEESSVGEFMLGSRRMSLSPTISDSKLAQSIPGLADLQTQTQGDDRITIVVLDGNADLQRSCFEGANVSQVFPYWHEPAEPIADEDYAIYSKINHSDKDTKAEKLEAAFSKDTLERVYGDFHATGIISVIIGQPESPVPGIAPLCRVINIPLNTEGADELISPLNLARAFDLALELGANIIHCAACRPTQTGEGENFFAQAVKNVRTTTF